MKGSDAINPVAAIFDRLKNLGRRQARPQESEPEPILPTPEESHLHALQADLFNWMQDDVGPEAARAMIETVIKAERTNMLANFHDHAAMLMNLGIIVGCEKMLRMLDEWQAGNPDPVQASTWQPRRVKPPALPTER